MFPTGWPNGNISPAINNTNATTDLALSVNQTAFVNFSAATSVPLHIATADSQLYELTIQANGANPTTSVSLFLNPNNTTYTNFFIWEYIHQVGGVVSGSGSYQSAFPLSTVTDTNLNTVRISTNTLSKTVSSFGFGWSSTAASIDLNFNVSRWLGTASASSTIDTTTLWTSLGTMIFPVATTGKIYIRRLL